MNAARSKVRRFADVQQLTVAAALAVVEASETAIADRGRFFLALSGGSTPRELYQLLASPKFRGELDWSRVGFFWGDERAVSPDHADSNFRMANECLLEPLGIDHKQIHRIQAENPDLNNVAKIYQRETAAAFGVKPNDRPPQFDLILLGMGPDGHTASLFPGTTALAETSRWIVAHHVPKLSADRITMTAPLINQARHVMFLVSGKDKAGRLAEVLEGPNEPNRLPSQMIRPHAGTLTWLIDELASAELADATEQNE